MHKLLFNLISKEGGELLGSTTREMRVIPSQGDVICMDWPGAEEYYIVDSVVHRIDDYPSQIVMIIYNQF